MTKLETNIKLKNLITDNLEIAGCLLAEKVGLSADVIYKLINGNYEHKPKLITVKKICKYFNVDFRDYI